MKQMVQRLLLALILAFALPVCAEQTRRPDSTITVRGERIMPPASLGCDRNQLSSWTGVVTEYQRITGSTRIVIHTDYETVERSTLLHEDSDDPSGSFMIFGQPFEFSDWLRIESAPGVLIEGMRATAWICEDPEVGMIIDWHPGELSIRNRATFRPGKN